MTHRCEPGSLTPNPQPGPRADAADVSEEAFPGGVKRGQCSRVCQRTMGCHRPVGALKSGLLVAATQ